MSARHRLLIFLLIVANLVVGAYLIVFRGDPETTAANPPVLKKPQTLPVLELQDGAGRKLQTSDLAGRHLFVQFINPHIQTQVASYLRVRSQKLKHPTSWLLISRNARELRRRLPPDNSDYIVEADYDRLRDLFGVAKCCEEWLIFDQGGNLKDSGRYDEDSTASRLKHLVDGDDQYSPAVLSEALNRSADDGVFKQIHTQALRSKSGKAVAVLFSSACTGCPEDYLIELLKTHAAKTPHVAFVALLPNTFTRPELESFKTNLEVPFPVLAANPPLSKLWLDMAEQYGWKALNGSVVVVDDGRIITVVQGLQETRSLLEGLVKSS